VPWAFVFALRRDLAPVPRHPAQLYEAAAYLVIFAVLWTLYRRLGARTPRGLLLGLFLALVFAARFGIEFVKLRQAAFGAALPLSMGQLLSVPAVAVGLVLIVRALRRPTPEPEATSS
jgi:prolipoprotein diacylglyceryltransferase